jgi:phenylacetate-CoA ligase
MWGERVYDFLPLALQNVAVSVKGWQFHRDRYRSSSFEETARTLEQNERLSLEVLYELQFREFCFFAQYCYEKSPYYRRQWKARKLHPSDIRKPEDIQLLPIVPKQDLRARTEEFFTEEINRRMTAAHTSGTTGSPLTVYFSKEDVGRRHAFLDRCRRWAGVQIGKRRATFTGRNIIPQGQKRPPFWRFNKPGKQLLFSSYHLTVEHLPAYVEAMGAFQPEIVDGYPSAIHVIADHILRSGGSRDIRPLAILVSAETVLDHQRRMIEAAFGAKLYNQYASSEGAPFVSECKRGRLHVHTDSGMIEILDIEGNPVKEGQAGRMVVTSFTTHIAPLLRYAIGDMAIQSEAGKICECGLPFPTLEAIVGRVDDVLYTPDRGFVGRLDTVFKSVPNSIIEAQIVQTSLETIILRLVPDRSKYKPEHADKVVAEMRKTLGQIIVIRVEEVRTIPRSANGKMRPVVNLCRDLLPSTLLYAPEEAISVSAK